MFEDLIKKQEKDENEAYKDTYTCIGCDKVLKRGETCPTCHRKDLVQTDGY